MIKKIVLIFYILILPVYAQYIEKFDKEGILVWFYTFEIKQNHNNGNIYQFKQAAGTSYNQNIISNIAPLSIQSKVKKDSDENWYLTPSKKKTKLNSKRPFFLGNILAVTLPSTRYILLKPKYNKEVKLLKFDKALDKYLVNRNDLQINDVKIQKIKNDLLVKNPKIYDYILAVDKFVHNQLKYKKPTRPNTAVELLSMDNAWCGEFNKLKESLLRAAKIPTRDVYLSHYGMSGPSYDNSGASKSHVWLQSYIPNVGWISIPSTRKMFNKKQFITLRGGYYIRALELFKYQKEIQSQVYSYSKIKRIGGIRGNGMFIEMDTKKFDEVKTILNSILDYDSIPSKTIFKKIILMPNEIKTLMYWFLISVPDKDIFIKATRLFITSISEQTHLDFNKFYVISPTIVKKRIDKFLLSEEY